MGGDSEAGPVPDASNGVAAALAAQRTPEELVAKSIAPVKKQYLRPPPLRPCSKDQNDAVPEGSAKSSTVVKEKKSKRQLKRERREVQKSPLGICPEVAKRGDVTRCPYKDKCRYSHDIEAYKAQKPEDIEGECPFMAVDEPCPYGLSCRFMGTHKDGVADGDVNAHRRNSEINGLSKNVQKLLWKNKVKFTKADAKLKALGLMGHAKSKTVATSKENGSVSKDCDVTDGNGCSEFPCNTDDKLEETAEIKEDGCVDETFPSDEMDLSAEVKEEGGANDTFPSEESRPSKKARSVFEEEFVTGEADDGGASAAGKVVGKTCLQPEPEAAANVECLENDKILKTHPREKKIIDFREKLYLAPLTTVGNLPFRRVCKGLGADITCGEMAMCTNLLQGQASEWALLRRHSSEDLFGVQICGAYPDTVAHTVELIEQECTVDFIDINMGCPIDIVVNKGAGSALLTKPMRMKGIVQAASGTVDIPMTVKVRTAYFEGKNRIDSLIADMGNWGASAVTIHGRSRQQRYSKLADWEYVYQCAKKAPDSLQVLGNGDVFSYVDWNKHKVECPQLSSCMIARGALIKPWIFTEIKEQRHWDITSGERFNILKDYVRCGLEHWGSDTKGVETTRRFLLEWLSYTCRYVPVGLLDVIPQRLSWRPPTYFGRDDLETLMASDSAADWVRLSEMLLGKVPDGFTFAPKHKSNAYDRAENG
ncbi:tRNA-dihydrouridine(47) synthase [NAD(P)(+)]-like [Argentina anserina]|uniref:tRNA-dihydrouridine(47) synthase [NAD(P)(+)]-like n=1 Tax=Argentina anserina TaxID=57926 RepID=UPI00217693ED|nr:tRNA-dihydrouridine(47) synthase [NAD(P)(+)]-like [Potentilla anserina]